MPVGSRKSSSTPGSIGVKGAFSLIHHAAPARIRGSGHRGHPPSDPDFPRLHGRRNDSESLNRSLEDTLFLGRAHSLGWRRQQIEMLGRAVMVNALTMARHRAAGLESAA